MKMDDNHFLQAVPPAAKNFISNYMSINLSKKQKTFLRVFLDIKFFMTRKEMIRVDDKKIKQKTGYVSSIRTRNSTLEKKLLPITKNI